MNTPDGTPSLSRKNQQTYNKLTKIFKKIGYVEDRLPIILGNKATLERFLDTNPSIKQVDLEELLDALGNPEGKEIGVNMSNVVNSLISHSGIDPFIDARRLREIGGFHQK